MTAPLITPHSDALQASVEQLYIVFGRGHVSERFEVCQCPVCMTEDTRLQIIKTPSDQLSPDLISEYSNSAHGVPEDLDDLRLMLPRYLDLMARDEMVDDIGVGTELLRFGQAVRADADVYSPTQWQAINNWAEHMLWHFAHADACQMDNLHTPMALMDTLLAGGWDVDHITGVTDAIFQDAQIGQDALAAFLRANQQNLNIKRAVPKLDWFGTRYASEATRTGLAQWFNSVALGEVLQMLATDPKADTHDQTYARILLDAQGSFETASLPKHQNT